VYIYDRVSLTADASAISVASGAAIALQLDLGVPSADLTYLAGLSVSGSKPGVILGPGSYVPLNPDTFAGFGLSLLGSNFLKDFLGTLDAQGRATLVLNWPAGFGASLEGKTLTIAAVAVSADNRPKAGSSAVSLELTP